MKKLLTIILILSISKLYSQVLDSNTTINANGNMIQINDGIKHQVILDPANKYWAIGDYYGDYGNATSVTIIDSIGTVRIDGDLQVQGIRPYDSLSLPLFWNGGEYLAIGYVVDSIWKFDDNDTLYYRRIGYSHGGDIFTIPSRTPNTPNISKGASINKKKGVSGKYLIGNRKFTISNGLIINVQ